MLKKISADGLEHTVAEVIAVYLVYLRQLAYAYHNDVSRLLIVERPLYILKEAVLIAEPCQLVYRPV